MTEFVLQFSPSQCGVETFEITRLAVLAHLEKCMIITCNDSADYVNSLRAKGLYVTVMKDYSDDKLKKCLERFNFKHILIDHTVDIRSEGINYLHSKKYNSVHIVIPVGSGADVDMNILPDFAQANIWRPASWTPQGEMVCHFMPLKPIGSEVHFTLARKSDLPKSN